MKMKVWSSRLRAMVTSNPVVGGLALATIMLLVFVFELFRKISQ